ncbi:MAG: TolC family protein [Candidatus Symbiothrix sp.]|jgi:outer membrane protein TolC|nr:TolC family protein [Candidatus Symbiothrix sp.]
MKTNINRYFISLLFAILSIFFISAQEKALYFSLSQCIERATEHSLQTFRAKNMYLSGYWEFQTYKAGRLPAISFQLTPIQYNSNFVKRYNYEENIEIYRQQQSITSTGGLSVSQNVEWTGGTFILNSDIDYMKNFGETENEQFSSTPVRLSYSQSLFGFNRFKWEKKIEPLKYEKVKQQYLYSREEISETASRYFFLLAMAQAEYDMAVENVASTDSLYLAGNERIRISSISQADLLTLELDKINAENALENAISQLQKNTFDFISYFNLEKDCKIHLTLPGMPDRITVSIEEALMSMKENNPDILSYRQQVLESEQEVERTKKTAGFDATFSASVGFNQAGNNFREAYIDPSRQDMIRLGVTIPVVDWGIRKGRINMAKNNLNVIQFTVQQQEQELEQEIIETIAEFNKQQRLIVKSKEALAMAITSYNINKQRFIVGKADISTLTLSLNRRKDAQRNYISALGSYWNCYYAIRKLTLYDYEKQESLSFRFDKLREK